VRLGLLFTFLLLLSAQIGVSQESSSSSANPAAVTPAIQPTQPDAEAISQEITKAEAAIVKSDWKTAEPILDSWLAQHPADARALFDSGYVADAQGRNDDAIGLYRKALGANPRSFEAEVSLGLLLARQGKATEARPVLETATSLEPGPAGTEAKARAWRAMAQIDVVGAEGKPDPTQASIDLLEALKLSPESKDDTLLAARLAEMTGDTAAAEAGFRKVLKTDPGSTVASAGLAHLLIAQKKYPEAEELLQAAAKKSPDDPAITAQLAAVLVAEDKADVLPLLQQFHQKHPQDKAIAKMLAQVLADAGEYADSDQLYLALLTTNPKDADLLVGHGQNLIRQKRYPEAVKSFTGATEADSSNGEAWNGLAFAALQTHQPEITLHALTERSKFMPESATIYFLWATAYDTLHDKKQAAAYYHHFLEASTGKFPDQEWQARQRLKLLEQAP